MAATGSGDDEQETENIDGDDEAAPGLADHDPMNPSAWYGERNICGSCIAWRPEDPRPGETVAAGACKLRPELGRVPATLKMCNIYKPRGQFVYQPGREPPSRRRKTGAAKVMRRSAEGEMVQTRAPARASMPQAAFERREKDVEVEYEFDRSRGYDSRGDADVPGSTEPRPEKPVAVIPRTVDLGGGEESAPVVKSAIADLLRREHGRAKREIHSKYRTGGVAVATTKDGGEVRISAERFFAILDRLRSSLDTLESAIAERDTLAGDREEMVALIKRMQGSFTTFNLMFSDKNDYFSGKE